MLSSGHTLRAKLSNDFNPRLKISPPSFHFFRIKFHNFQRVELYPSFLYPSRNKVLQIIDEFNRSISYFSSSSLLYHHCHCYCRISHTWMMPALLSLSPNPSQAIILIIVRTCIPFDFTVPIDTADTVEIRICSSDNKISKIYNINFIATKV